MQVQTEGAVGRRSRRDGKGRKGEKERCFMLDAKKAIKHLILDRGVKVNQLAASQKQTAQSFSNWLYRPDSPRINKTESILAELGCHLAIVDDESGEILF